MRRKSKKRPPVAIQRVNRMLSRLEMAQALELQADGDRDMLDLATLLRSQDKQTARCSPHTLAQKIGLPYSRIVEAFKQMKRMESVVVVAQRLPAITEGIAVDAESKQVMCETCLGEGEIETKAQVGKEGEPGFMAAETKTCIPCEGTGHVLRPGDPIARKQVLEMMGLAGQHAMPIVAPGSNILIAQGGESLEETLKAVKRGSNGTATREVRSGEGADTRSDRDAHTTSPDRVLPVLTNDGSS